MPKSPSVRSRYFGLITSLKDTNFKLKFYVKMHLDQSKHEEDMLIIFSTVYSNKAS